MADGSSTIGTCSLCGGRVSVPWYTTNPVPICEKCGATKQQPHGPVVPMENPKRREPDNGYVLIAYKTDHLERLLREWLKHDLRTHDIGPTRCSWCGMEYPFDSTKGYLVPHHTETCLVTRTRAAVAAHGIA